MVINVTMLKLAIPRVLLFFALLWFGAAKRIRGKDGNLLKSSWWGRSTKQEAKKISIAEQVSLPAMHNITKDQCDDHQKFLHKLTELVDIELDARDAANEGRQEDEINAYREQERLLKAAASAKRKKDFRPGQYDIALQQATIRQFIPDPLLLHLITAVTMEVNEIDFKQEYRTLTMSPRSTEIAKIAGDLATRIEKLTESVEEKGISAAKLFGVEQLLWDFNAWKSANPDSPLIRKLISLGNYARSKGFEARKENCNMLWDLMIDSVAANIHDALFEACGESPRNDIESALIDINCETARDNVLKGPLKENERVFYRSQAEVFIESHMFGSDTPLPSDKPFHLFQCEHFNILNEYNQDQSEHAPYPEWKSEAREKTMDLELRPGGLYFMEPGRYEPQFVVPVGPGTQVCKEIKRRRLEEYDDHTLELKDKDGQTFAVRVVTPIRDGSKLFSDVTFEIRGRDSEAQAHKWFDKLQYKMRYADGNVMDFFEDPRLHDTCPNLPEPLTVWRELVKYTKEYEKQLKQRAALDFVQRKLYKVFERLKDTWIAIGTHQSSKMALSITKPDGGAAAVEQMLKKTLAVLQKNKDYLHSDDITYLSELRESEYGENNVIAAVIFKHKNMMKYKRWLVLSSMDPRYPILGEVKYENGQMIMNPAYADTVEALFENDQVELLKDGGVGAKVQGRSYGWTEVETAKNFEKAVWEKRTRAKHLHAQNSYKIGEFKSADVWREKHCSCMSEGYFPYVDGNEIVVWEQLQQYWGCIYKNFHT